MENQSNKTRIPFSARLSCTLSLMAVCLGLIALVGWIGNIPLLTSFGSSGVPMTPSMALLFVLYGMILPFRMYPPATSLPARLATLFTWVGGGLALLLSILALSDIHSSIEYLGLSISGGQLGPMSTATALCFLLVGCSHLLLFRPGRKRAWLSFGLDMIVISVGIVFIIVYLLDALLFQGRGIVPPALPAAVALLLLGLALLLVARLHVRPLRDLEDQRNARVSALLALVFILLVSGIIGAGVLYARQQQNHFRTRIETELNAIADLKVAQLQQWSRERFSDASPFFKNSEFSELVEEVISTPNLEARQKIQIWLERIVSMPQYRRISLVDTARVEQFFAPASSESPPENLEDIAAPQDLRHIFFRDFHRKKAQAHPVELDLVVPILAAPDWHRVVGILVLDLDPEAYLYPMIQRWPTPNRSAETLLVRRDGDDVLFLNSLRFYQNAAHNLRLPLSTQDLPVAMAVRGKTGIVQGIDYRGMSVLAALRNVPDSPWFFVARMDLDEINQPLRDRLVLSTGLVFTLLLGAGTTVGFIWRNQRARFYRLRLESVVAMEEYDQRMRLIFESVIDGILVVELVTMKIVIANEAICRMLGYTHPELLTMKINDIHPDANVPRVVDEFQRQARGETSLAVNTPMRRKDGSIFYADISSTTIQLGENTCMLGTFRDITDRMQAEARIEHLNRVLRAIRNINQLIVLAESVEELIKNACTALIEYQSYVGALIVLIDAENLTTAHAVAGEDEALLALVRQVEMGELPGCCQDARAEDGATLIDGRPCSLVAVCGSPQKMSIRLEHQSRIFGYLIVSVGIPNSKDLEEEELLIELAGDLAYSLHNMAVKKTMLRGEEERKKLEAQFFQAQKMEAVGRLAGGVAHDFNNLLSVILGYSELLINSAFASPSSAEALKEIHNAAIRSKNLTRQLLAFSRKQLLDMHVVDVNKVIGDFEKLLRRTIGEDIRMKLVLSSEPAPVKADVSQLEQILMNLAVNARDAMPDGGFLTIETARIELDEEYAVGKVEVIPGAYVMIGVSDSGTGMDQKTQARIFEPFFTTKPQGKGTGLGLSTVYGVVKQHGGHVTVYSEIGRGTTFKIYLPLVAANEVREETKTAKIVTRTQAETILVVEDDFSVRNLACHILRCNGYTVLEAEDGDDAVAIAQHHNEPIHLLLTDVIMPKMNGPEVFKEIDVAYPGIRALYMSGYAEDIIARQGVLKEGISFIQKPFSATSLLEKVNETLNS